ncbi:MAG: glycerate kinase [Candidatus Dormibacteraeota bacterium]|nr:glycerate kinase [Candidatus Dormibacteraeota bacterium]
MDRPRQVLCAPNAFKGSLSAEEVAIAMALGVEDAGFSAQALPLADGGDGTLDVLIAAAGDASSISHHTVHGPLGEPASGRVGWLGDGRAVVEMADAAGLRLLRSEQLEPLLASSRGCGELIVAALDGGATEVIVGVGGSASSDGGAGILQALGSALLDSAGREVGPGAAGLLELERIDCQSLRRLDGRVLVAVDVRNPLLGPFGAAAVFGPQKGAGAAQVDVIEQALGRLAAMAERDCDAAGLADADGAGAAGGAGFGLLVAGAELLPGASLVCDVAGLTPAFIAEFELVLTGEGRLDSQTSFGKAPAEVAARAVAAGVTVAAVAGTVLDPLPAMFTTAVGLDSVAEPGADLMRDAAALVRLAAAEAVRRVLGSGAQ